MAEKPRTHTHTREQPQTLTLNPKPKTHVTAGIQTFQREKTFCNKGDEGIPLKISNIRRQHHPNMGGEPHTHTHPQDPNPKP